MFIGKLWFGSVKALSWTVSHAFRMCGLLNASFLHLKGCELAGAASPRQIGFKSPPLADDFPSREIISFILNPLPDSEISTTGRLKRSRHDDRPHFSSKENRTARMSEV